MWLGPKLKSSTTDASRADPFPGHAVNTSLYARRRLPAFDGPGKGSARLSQCHILNFGFINPCFYIIRLFALLLLLTWAAAATWAQAYGTIKTPTEQDCRLQGPINSETLVQMALSCSPGQAGVASRWQSERERVRAEGRLDDPQVSVMAGPETFGKDQVANGYVLDVSQTLPWPGTLALEKEAARSRSNRWEARLDEYQVGMARDIRRVFADFRYHRQLLAINREHQQLWEELIDIINIHYANGTASKSSLIQARQEALSLKEEAIQLKAAIVRDSAKLEQRAGLAPDSELAEQPLAPAEPVSLTREAFNDWLAGIQAQPGMEGLQAEQSQTQVQLRLVGKDRLPDLTFKARYNSLWQNPDLRWVVGVGLNVPLDFGKRSGKEASLKARNAALEWEQKDLANRLRSELIQAHSHWEEGRELVQLYRDELLPLAEENMDTARQAYQSGTSDFLSLLNAQRQTLQTQRRAEQALRKQSRAMADLIGAAGLVQGR